MIPLAATAGLLKVEWARRIRHWKRAIYAGAVAAVLLAASLVFFLIAVFLYLAQAHGGPAAALIVAGGLLLLAGIAFAIANLRTRRRDLSADLQLAVTGQMEQMRRLSPARLETSTLLKLLGVAFAIGLLAGRKR